VGHQGSACVLVWCCVTTFLVQTHAVPFYVTYECVAVALVALCQSAIDSELRCFERCKEMRWAGYVGQLCCNNIAEAGAAVSGRFVRLCLGDVVS
jgi:hypothetical protein